MKIPKAEEEILGWVEALEKSLKIEHRVLHARLPHPTVDLVRESGRGKRTLSTARAGGLSEFPLSR